MHRLRNLWLILALTLLLAPVARPASGDSGVAAEAIDGEAAAAADARVLRERVKQLEAENRRLRDERRRVEADAVAAAETKQDVGFSPKYSRDGFTLADADGDNRLTVYGQLQLRYVAHEAAPAPGVDDVSGFTLRRARLGVKGRVDLGSRFDYKVRAAFGRDDGELRLQDALIGWHATKRLNLIVGQTKLPYARQELISSARQLAAERSVATGYFTLDRSQGVFAEAELTDDLDLSLAVTDGVDNPNTDFFTTGDAGLAYTGRLDWRVFGGGKQDDDVVAWSGRDDALFAGGAVNLNQSREEGDQLGLTADVLYKTGPVSVLAAGYFLDSDGTDGGTDLGLTLEGGLNVDDRWQPFARFDYVELDGADDPVLAYALGVNYFFRKHQTKFTADVNFVSDLPGSSGRTPNRPGDGAGLFERLDDQVSLRLQFQLLF